jgi:integrase
MGIKMKGFLKQRAEGSWSVVLYLGKNPVDGKKKYKWHTFHGNKKQAQAELARLVNDLNTGAYVEPSRDSVQVFLKKWLELVKSKLAGKTFERYAEIVRGHLVPAIGNVVLARLTPMQIQNYYSQALERGRLDGKGGLSAQTVVHHHRVLHDALQQAVKWQLLVRNPADAVEPPKPEVKEMRALDEAETAWFLAAAEGTRLYIPIWLAIATGMRRGEILALRWRDVDVAKGFVRVQRSLEQTDEGVRFKEPKRKRSRRPISMPAILIETLLAHQSEQAELKANLGSHYTDNDLVCCYEDGRIWIPESFTSQYFAFTRKIGVKVRFHDLRHSHASQLLRAGVHPKVVSERLGHSSIGITLDTYSHLLPGVQEEAARTVDSALRTAIKSQTRRPI